MEDFLRPFESEIVGARRSFDQHVVMWCIENFVPLKQFREGELHIVFYERLCAEPESAIRAVLGFVGEPYAREALAAARKPSALSRKKSAITTGGDLIEHWRSHVTHEQIQSAVRILRAFGLDRIYGEGSMPMVREQACLE